MCNFFFSTAYTWYTTDAPKSREKHIFQKLSDSIYLHVHSTLTWSLNLWFDISQSQEPCILKSLKNDSSEGHFANLNFLDIIWYISK